MGKWNLQINNLGSKKTALWSYERSQNEIFPDVRAISIFIVPEQITVQVQTTNFSKVLLNLANVGGNILNNLYLDFSEAKKGHIKLERAKTGKKDLGIFLNLIANVAGIETDTLDEMRIMLNMPSADNVYEALIQLYDRDTRSALSMAQNFSSQGYEDILLQLANYAEDKGDISNAFNLLSVIPSTNSHYEEAQELLAYTCLNQYLETEDSEEQETLLKQAYEYAMDSKSINLLSQIQRELWNIDVNVEQSPDLIKDDIDIFIEVANKLKEQKEKLTEKDAKITELKDQINDLKLKISAAQLNKQGVYNTSVLAKDDPKQATALVLKR